MHSAIAIAVNISFTPQDVINILKMKLTKKRHLSRFFVIRKNLVCLFAQFLYGLDLGNGF